jgi:ribonuclease P protein component
VLAAAQRIRRRQEFTAVVRGGRRAGRGSLVVHVASTPPARIRPVRAVADRALIDPVGAGTTPADLPARAGFVIPRTVGSAVMRNKVRRRLRHLVRDRIGALPPGTSVVVRALPTASARTYDELAESLDQALAAALGTRGRVGASRTKRSRDGQ